MHGTYVMKMGILVSVAAKSSCCLGQQIGTAFCGIHIDYRNYYAGFSDRKPVSVDANKFLSARLDKIRLVTGFEAYRPDAPRPLDGPFVPHKLMSSQGSPVP